MVAAMCLSGTVAWADGAVGLNGTVMSLPDTRVELSAVHSRRPGDDPRPRASLEIDSRQPNLRPSTSGSGPAPGIANDPSSTRVNYVGWASVGGRSSVGVSMGVDSIQAQGASSSSLPYDARTAVTSFAPEVGVRLRSDVDASHRLDLSAWSAKASLTAGAIPDRRSYIARVEMQFQSAHGKLGFDAPHGAIGMQMSSTSQMLVRAQHGGPMMYFRSRW